MPTFLHSHVPPASGDPQPASTVWRQQASPRGDGELDLKNQDVIYTTRCGLLSATIALSKAKLTTKQAADTIRLSPRDKHRCSRQLSAMGQEAEAKADHAKALAALSTALSTVKQSVVGQTHANLFKKELAAVDAEAYTSLDER